MNPANHAPVADNQSVTTAEDTAKGITLTASDADGEDRTYAIVGSPARGTLSGKATFGFVSKYPKGAATPSGNTEFQFHEGSLNFQSTSYEWLVISGARGNTRGAGR